MPIIEVCNDVISWIFFSNLLNYISKLVNPKLWQINQLKSLINLAQFEFPVFGYFSASKEIYTFCLLLGETFDVRITWTNSIETSRTKRWKTQFKNPLGMFKNRKSRSTLRNRSPKMAWINVLHDQIGHFGSQKTAFIVGRWFPGSWFRFTYWEIRKCFWK